MKGARDMLNEDTNNENNDLIEQEESLTTKDNIDEEMEINSIDKRKKALYITNIVVNSIFYFFIFLLLLFSISQIAGSKEGKVKNVFGLGYEIVLSDSMTPTFEKGDLVWASTNFKTSKLKVGDIITFWDTESAKDPFLNTHRIVDIIYNQSDNSISCFVLQGDIYKSYKDGMYYYDNCTEEEKTLMRYTQEVVQIVNPDQVKAKYISHWDGAGNFVNWLSNPKKGFVLVIIFTGLFLVFEMFMVIKNVMEIRTAKLQEANEAEKEEMKKSLDEEREKMKAELLAQLRAEQAATAKENAESKPNDEKDITDSSEKGDEEK